MTDDLYNPNCLSCREGAPLDECPESKRPCGHHCNCSWQLDVCHWCGGQFGSVDDPDYGKPPGDGDGAYAELEREQDAGLIAAIAAVC